jgi:hypothetical protein
MTCVHLWILAEKSVKGITPATCQKCKAATTFDDSHEVRFGYLYRPVERHVRHQQYSGPSAVFYENH